MSIGNGGIIAGIIVTRAVCTGTIATIIGADWRNTFKRRGTGVRAVRSSPATMI
jgi:hypothetical protein